MSRLTLIRLAAIGVLVALIELVCRVGLITPYTLIPPSQMAAGLLELARSDEFASVTLRTVSAIIIVKITSDGAPAHDDQPARRRPHLPRLQGFHARQLAPLE